MNENLYLAIEASLAAGREIIRIYNEEDFQIELKSDESPLTIADKRANEIINGFLVTSKLPVISEENKQLPYEERKKWKKCWIVDPLDGTKEFIKKNGEFTVNIALVVDGKPALGVICAPAQKVLYFADVREARAFKSFLSSEATVEEVISEAVEIKPAEYESPIKVIGSRSHMNENTSSFIKNLTEVQGEVQFISKGSSLKFCSIADGEAHIYPRFGPTMEWDTAAGHAICSAVGISCVWRDTGQEIEYNRKDLLNRDFIVRYEG